jgi:hypothetical protein
MPIPIGFRTTILDSIDRMPIDLNKIEPSNSGPKRDSAKKKPALANDQGRL